MKVLPLFLLASALAGGSGCARSVDMAAEQEALRQADSAYTAAVQSKDLDAIVGFWSSDGVMYPPNEAAVSGSAEITRYVRTFVNTPGITVAFAPADVRISPAGGMGYTIKTAHVTLTDTKGATVSEELRDFHVWKKEAHGRWIVAADIWNSPTPPAPPPATPSPRR